MSHFISSILVSPLTVLSFDKTVAMQATPTASTYVATVPSFSPSRKYGVRLLISLIAFGLVVAGFVLQVVNTAKRNNDCKESLGSGTCRDHYRMYWWTSAFQFFVALVCLLFLATGFAKSVRIFLSSCLSISTVLCMLATDFFITEAIFDEYDGYYGYDGYFHEYRESDNNGDHADTVAVIGYILSAVGNFLLLFLVGGEPTQPSALNAGSNNMGATPLQPTPVAQTYTQSPTSPDIWYQRTRPS